MGTAFYLDDMIMSEEPIYGFTEPETVILNLADYFDEYENGQGVAVEINLFSDGNFYAIAEDADYMTGKAKLPDKGAAIATASNAEAASAEDRNETKRESAEDTVSINQDAAEENDSLVQNMPKATASNAEATPSNAETVTVKTNTNKKKKQNTEPIVFESNEDGMMTFKWSGNPQSGAIAVTILEMDGTQVNVDSIDVEEKAGAVSG